MKNFDDSTDVESFDELNFDVSLVFRWFRLRHEQKIFNVSYKIIKMIECDHNNITQLKVQLNFKAEYGSTSHQNKVGSKQLNSRLISDTTTPLYPTW